MDNKEEDFSAEKAPGHNRRISRLDNVTKFQASLDSIKVNRTASVSAKEDAVPIKEENEEDLSAEEVKKPEPEQAPQTTSKPDAPQEKPKSETDEVGGDSSKAAKESVDSEKSAGAEQSSSAPDKSDAPDAL